MSADKVAAEINMAAAKPPIVIDAAYYGRLQDIAVSGLERASDVAELLLQEVERADIRSSGEMPPDAISIGSAVTFRYDDTGLSQTIQLVLPKDADIARMRISVFTPIGATLIGLSKGHQMSWTTRLGERRSLTVLDVIEPAIPPSTSSG